MTSRRRVVSLREAKRLIRIWYKHHDDTPGAFDCQGDDEALEEIATSLTRLARQAARGK